MLARSGNFSCNPASPGLLRPVPAPNGTRLVRLVIVESGSAGLGVYAGIDDPAILVSIAQAEEETAVNFALRVVQVILQLERASQSIERAVLLLGRGCEPGTAGARLTIARALITHSVTAGGRTLPLVREPAGKPLDDRRVSAS